MEKIDIKRKYFRVQNPLKGATRPFNPTWNDNCFVHPSTFAFQPTIQCSVGRCTLELAIKEALGHKGSPQGSDCTSIVP